MPLREPEVTLELFKKTAPEFSYQILPFSAPVVVQEEPAVAMVDVDSSSSSSSSDSSASSPERKSDVRKTSKPVAILENSVDEAILAKFRRVTHAMLIDHSESDNLPCHQDRTWRPACGARMNRAKTEFLDEWSPMLSFCQHPGCKKAWSVMGMF